MQTDQLSLPHIHTTLELFSSSTTAAGWVMSNLCKGSMDHEVTKWSQHVKDSSNFERWMSELPQPLKNVPIINLAIPGTHDSMSSGITKSADISPDASGFIKTLSKYLGPIVKPLVYRWCVTQDQSATGQLVAGIRYFDLRMAVNKRTNALHFVHGMYAQEITSPLFDINEFLRLHEDEVIILDLQHFYDFTPQHHMQLQDVLNNLFGSKLCPLPADKDISKLTLNWMSKHGHQVIVIYRNNACQSDNLWPSIFWPTPWPETTSASKMIQFLSRGLQSRPPNAGYVSQCVLTPDISFVTMHIYSTLKQKCCKPCNRAVLPWLREQGPGPSGINVVISDYFDFNLVDFPFVKTIVLLNYLHCKE